jgi:hypothetical protein
MPLGLLQGADPLLEDELELEELEDEDELEDELEELEELEEEDELLPRLMVKLPLPPPHASPTIMQ